MNILYDHQAFSMQEYGGISRYYYETIKNLNLIADCNAIAALRCSNNHYIQQEKSFTAKSFFPHRNFKGKGYLINKINIRNSIQEINKKHFDIFHPTYYDPYFLNYIGKSPFVVTVYDMIHEKFRNIFSKNDKTAEYKSILVNKATKVITISESTKKDLIEILGTDESKIEVVYLGNSIKNDFLQNTIENIPEKYILFVGARGGYKNFIKFVKSISKILIENKKISIVCAGGGSFNREELELFNNLKIREQLYQFNLIDKKLHLFYKNAILFVFPSLYEGFGIPILESFSCSCPIACSNTSSLPEVAGDAAIYFDPNDSISIKSAVEKVMHNEGLREMLVKKGLKRLQSFSWKETAKKTKIIYDGII